MAPSSFLKKKEPCQMCDFMCEVNRVFGTRLKVDHAFFSVGNTFKARSCGIWSIEKELRMLLLDVFMHKIAKDSKI